MGENTADVDHAIPIFDYSDQPIPVAANVENRVSPNGIGAREILADIGEINPIGGSCYVIPMHQSRQRSDVRRAVFRNRFLAYDPQIDIMLPQW
jgi:hypothetical protein